MNALGTGARERWCVTTGVVAVCAAAIFLWGALSGRLERATLTAPIVFVGVGLLLSRLGDLEPHVESEVVKLLTEVTLVWVLFSDAATVTATELRADARVIVRLLACALPVTVVLGWLAALAVLPGSDVWLALLVGAALAPTDAALGAAVFTNPAVPEHVRGILNIESGLNDGIVTPVVIVALAGAGQDEGAVSSTGVMHALSELAIGACAGLAVGYLGGLAVRWARRRHWTDEEYAGSSVLALALLAYAGSLSVRGNGFVAAFVAGLAFGNTARSGGPRRVKFVQEAASASGLLVWTLFGMVAVPRTLDHLEWAMAAYVVLSLTVIRMLPVAVALAGADLDRRAAWFIGWFGPRGLASVVFALMAVIQLGHQADAAVATIASTILVSVIAHGASAAPLARRYGAYASTIPTG